MREREIEKTAVCRKTDRQDRDDSVRSLTDKNIQNEDKGWELNNPFTWTVSNIDKVAEAVKYHPSAEYAPTFWNTYDGSFNTIPCNKPLRSLIIRAKRPHPAYAPIPDEEYLGDVTAMMWEGRLRDWLPQRESLEHYIGCRCRPNAEYGRSIIKAHGSRVYALVKDDGDSGSLCTGENSQGYIKKYVNQPLVSIDALACEDGQTPAGFLEHCAVPDNCPGRAEAESTRLWLMKTCRVTEYEMRICQAVADYGKCLDAWIVEEINTRIVVPSGNRPMTQEELYKFNFRIHKRAKYHYKDAMSGLW